MMNAFSIFIEFEFDFYVSFVLNIIGEMEKYSKYGDIIHKPVVY